MDYEKKYNDALNLAKSYYGNGCNEFLDTIFPELSESEDERIRREIIDFICQKIDRGSVTKEQREKSNSWLAYLEKQKEPENTSATTMAPSCWEVGLEKEIEVASKRFPEVSFAKLSRIAKRFYELGLRAGQVYAATTYNPPCYCGGPCTNPMHDCINCPRQLTGRINTTTGTSSAKLEESK